MLTSKNNKNTPWYTQILQEIQERERKCKQHYGPLNEYVLPPDINNPYREFKTLKQFKDKYPFDTKHRGTQCKLIYKNVSKTQDDRGRYYPAVKHESQCIKNTGIWDPHAVRRDDKYGQGLCWTSGQEKKCAQRIDPAYIRPYDMRNTPELKKNIKAARTKCEQGTNGTCTFIRTGKYSYDCSTKPMVVKNTPKDTQTTHNIIDMNPAEKPLDDMPIQVQGLETYLFDWYVGKKKQGMPPLTAELIGVGNRCGGPVPTTETKQDAINTDPEEDIKDETNNIFDLATLDPENENDFHKLSAAGVPFHIIEKLKKRRKQILDMNPTTDPSTYPDIRNMLDPYMRFNAIDDIDLTTLDPLNKDHLVILAKRGVSVDDIYYLRHRAFQIKNKLQTPSRFKPVQEILRPYMIKLKDMDDEPIPDYDDEEQDEDEFLDAKKKQEESLKEQEEKRQLAIGTKFLPSIPQSVVNMVMKRVAILEHNIHETKNTDNIPNIPRGMLAWHSLGSGKTFTAAGVMDAFWESKRDIIFASSIDAIASNPDYKFHEGALNLFPRFQKPPFLGKDRAQTLAKIGAAFQERGVRFLSFAKLANRVKKSQESKRGGATPDYKGYIDNKTRIFYPENKVGTKPLNGGYRAQKVIVEDSPVKPRKSRKVTEEPVKKPRKSRKAIIEDSPVKPRRSS